VKLLTGARMKQNPDGYAPFLQIPLHQYQYIDSFKVEIEHTDMQALFDVAIAPAGFNLEITMLDRTPSCEANVIPLPSYPTPDVPRSTDSATSVQTVRPKLFISGESHDSNCFAGIIMTFSMYLRPSFLVLGGTANRCPSRTAS
jgi:hypothetical protein